MGILKEIREKESSIEMEINPIVDMYDMLEHFLPGGYMDKEEMDQKSVIRGLWRKLVDYAEEVTDNLSDVQGIFKRQLLKDVKDFQVDVGVFRNEYIQNGPMTSGLQPTEAVERLKRFKELILIREKKLEVYAAGEELFGIRPTEYPELLKTKKELVLLDQLYSLYMDVVSTLKEYRVIPWKQVATNIQVMTDCFIIFDDRCKKLPKKLCEWEAYHVMRRDITDFMEILPLVTELSQECVKARHWEDIVKICGSPLPFDNDSLVFAAILDANLLKYKEEIEYICDSAQKQLKIENKIRDIKERWAGTSFEFGEWKTRNIPILRAYGVVIEDLEESQLQLQAMLAMRHVIFFKEFVQLKLSQLSDTSDLLELWIKVQNLWMSLESVFTGGDIAKQMPIEAKKFAKVDKDWIKVMMKASEIGSVTGCCSNELIRSTLPILFGELEKCQKSLEGYLEQKRKKFPRFYFVSNPVLLLLLSKGSDPYSIQPYYEKIFDSIHQVCHDLRPGGDKRKIIRIKSKFGTEQEAVSLANPILADGNIEDWLSTLEKEMRMTMKGLCRQAAVECNSTSLRDFILKNCGQFALLGIQFVWTAESQEALQKCRTTKGVMQTTIKRQNSTLSELSSLCLTDLGSIINRRKVEMLITVQLHQRDCFASLCKLHKEKKMIDPTDFEWLRQVRFYWKNSPNQDHIGQDACLISICDVDFKYVFEYLGCKDRLVITPLTDRAYITLSQALSMHLGGAPVGPAGTGKTETVKDLGRSLGIYVIVTNCTDQQRYSDVAKIFKGICQGGLWGCFDEFNRIELPVLSVVAQQVLSITSAKRLQASTFYFPGDQQSIGLKEDAAYFITMNPGYQGRQELPENLKSLFRSVSMMVPDREIIMKVKLCAAGYESFVDLARKFKTLYNIVELQLSKQKHYDFGLRNILSILRTVGVTKRENLLLNEEFLLMTTLRDMNLSKLVAQDIPIFLSLLKDVFPNAEFNNQTRHPGVSQAITEVIEKNGLISAHSWSAKIIQLYDTSLVRHGIILVGPAGSGKSEITRTLQLALSSHTQIPHKQIRMNPKAIRTEEMFGETDRLSGEWVDGIFASIWAKYNVSSRRDISWIVCDGPVDAVWIENLNTVLDDNKILTLANGDRIQMSENCKIMFEVEDLRNASPATVSRAGIIYVSDADLDWEPYVQSWLLQRTERQQNVFKKLFKRLVSDCSSGFKGNLFQYISRSCRPLVKLPRIALIQSCCRLLNCFMLSMDHSEDNADFEIELERIFCFALCWAFGGILDVEDRLKFQNYLCERSNQLPKGIQQEKINIFDFFIHSATLEWERWSVDLGENLLLKEDNSSSVIIPTTDTELSLYIMSNMYSLGHPLMLIGEPGVGKSILVRLFVERKRNIDDISFKTAILSGCTNPGDLHYMLETELDKRGGKTYGPGNGKKLIFFVDDISVPAQNCWGDQPTMEVLRQLVETNTLCFLEKDKRGDMKCVEDVRYISAMRYPKDGTNDIPNRLKRHFFILNCTTPSHDVIDSIYGQLLRWKFECIEGPSRKSILDFLGKLVDASIQLLQWVKKSMPPTPSKTHYFFNLRDLSRVFEGVVRASCDSITSEKPLIRLWRHECDRVFCDRLISIDEKKKFQDQITQISEATLIKPKEKLDLQVFFLNFLRDTPLNESGEVLTKIPKMYECVSDIQQVRGRIQELLEQFNLDNPSKKMNLILFDEALLHLLRISRVLGMPRSNMMLVGVGGSGKQSLARLASIIAGYHIFQLSITKSYNLSSFLDDIRSLFKLAGQSGKQVTFLIPESDLMSDSFLEQINSLLAIGDIPGLFPKDELTVMASELRSVMQKQHPNIPDTNDNLIRFFYARVRSNMHILLLFSPTSRSFAYRCRQFPNLINSCTIDWFLPWPEEALVAVTRAYLDPFKMEATELVKESLMTQMSQIHLLVAETCEEYFAKRGRPVFQTPRSFLGFLQTYKVLYTEKLDEINKMEISINIGLQKLVQGALDVEKMKIVLKEEETKLLNAEDAAIKMLETLQIKSLEAKKESDLVQRIKDQCEQDAAMILKEKQDAEEDLKKAQPFLDEAERAASSIKTNDLNELKKLAKPADVIKLIFDCVAILQMNPLVRVEKSPVALGVAKDKKNFDFILDSFQSVKSGMLADTRFLQNIFHFSKHQKDNINEETIELMMPYLELDGFSAVAAKNASKAAEGLFCWVKAMTMYHEASKVVKPKLEALRIAEGKFEAAQTSLQSSEQKLAKCQAVLNRLQEDFQTQMERKVKVEEYAQATKKKMEQATALITGLGGERTRWTEDSNRFIERKAHLIGDCIIGSAFLNYFGPFDKEYRDIITSKCIYELLQLKNIQVTSNLAFETFLVDNNRITDWNICGLPSDPLSIQNGILVERSQRFPLLIDPQGQAMAWLTKREMQRLPTFGRITVYHPKLREHFEYCLSEGKTLILEGVDLDLDITFNNVLEKNFISRAKSRFVTIMDRVCEYHEDFRLYLTTRAQNPHFSPEMQARIMLVDFTVTQKGLEEQLLAQVIQKEQKSLEEQLRRVQTDLYINTKALGDLDSLLLERLSTNTGNLLDDLELINVLVDTKTKAIEVNDKILVAEEVKRGIDEKRNQYRPVATRGAVLYFSIVNFARVNSMYQTSLDQFIVLFRKAIDFAERSNLASKRVGNILEGLTYVVYRYINRGLYEKDRISFLLVIALKILVTAGSIQPSDIALFVGAGASRKIQSAQGKPFLWMSNQAWLNAIQLSSDKPHFKNLLEDLIRNEQQWKKWYEDNEPENVPVPDYEGIIFDNVSINANRSFHRLLLIRCLREDRTILAVNNFLRSLEVIECPNSVLSKLPGLGPRYTEAVTDTVESIFNDMTPETPVLYLLSPGADPTESIELLARKKRQMVQCISMGEGQDGLSTKAINTAVLNGSWVLLQNCHLGLAYMDTLEEILEKIKETASQEFRLFLTSEPHPSFPISILQKSMKVTNEPPSGIRAGMLRSFTALVDQEKLDRIESGNWRVLVYSLCFLHSIVQERRKFGALGFTIPYEFNASDLSSSLNFLEKHLHSSTLSWSTIQYMVAEVYYGGRITDELDRRLFNSYCEAWLNPFILNPAFSFSPEAPILKSQAPFDYCIPQATDIDEIHRFICTFPKADSPEIFGLHPNADLTYRVKEASLLFQNILETQPKDAMSAKGEAKESIVSKKIKELISCVPNDFIVDDCISAIKNKLGGMEIPINVFLLQELQHFQRIIQLVRRNLIDCQRFLAGEITISTSLRNTIDALFESKVPQTWVFYNSVEEFSWLITALGPWFAGFTERSVQFRTWLEKGKPHSFWLAGFYNPKGLLTAMKQEVTRSHLSERWALDDVVYHSEVTDYEKLDQIKQAPREGVLLHGLIMDGAAWNKNEGTIHEAEPKKLFNNLPVLYVTATTKSEKKNRAQDYGPYGGYEAPCYKYAVRTDRYYIFSVILSSRDHRPLHWTLRGVALLCTTE
jgi:dynein heavy chain